jgi:hypothetical protein
MNELKLAVGRGGAHAGYTTILGNPGMGDYGKFQPGPGNSMGYDDLKVIEAKKFLQSVTQGVPGACTIDDAQSAAEVVSAAVASAAERVVGEGADRSGRHLRRRAGDRRSRAVTMTRPLVVGLGKVDPDLVTGVLGDGIEFVAEPTDADLAVASGRDRPRRRGGRRRLPRPHSPDARARPHRGGHRPGRPGRGHRPRHRRGRHPGQRHPRGRRGRPRARPRPGQAVAPLHDPRPGGPLGASATPAARSATWTARPSGSSATAGSAAASASSPRRSGCGCSPTTRSPRRPPNWPATTSTPWSPRATC